MSGRWRLVVVPALAALLFAVLATPSQAVFPGGNGKIVFTRCCDYHIRTMNPDGTGQSALQVDQFGLDPAWSPDGSRIAFVGLGQVNTEVIYTVKADGSDLRQVTPNAPGDFAIVDVEPAWSPDGQKIAFASNRGCSTHCDGLDIRTINVDGTGMTPLTSDGDVAVNADPAWSLDGQTIAFDRNVRYPDLSASEIDTMKPDGTGRATVTAGVNPNWSPTGQKLAFAATLAPDGPFDVYVANADGTGKINLTNSPANENQPAWSPGGTKIAFVTYRDGNDEIYSMNADGTGATNLTMNSAPDVAPDWQPIPINAYPRPKGATPFLTYLVPAYNACASPNRQHGPPLAFASCNPPTQTSNALTIGSADSNGKPTKSISSVRFETVVGNPSTTADEADVAITAQVTDVYTQAGLADYAGELRATTPLRITDKLNSAPPGGPGAGTVADIPYGFTIPCAETADTTTGGACLLSTSADALAPGAVKEGKRAIWGLGAVEVYDANDDLFMKQGIFVP